MTTRCGIGLCLSAIAFSFSAAAQDADCAATYVIQPGDSLATIAEIAYGSSTYQLIFSRNLGVITDVANPPVGAEIVIPCVPGVPSLTPDKEALLAAMPAPEPEPEPEPETETVEAETGEEVAAADGAEETEIPTVLEVAGTSAQATEPAPETVVATAASATPGALRLLTADGQAPFAGKTLRGGGMATELALAAMERIGKADETQIVFVDDRSAHLQHLLIDGSFDVGFPWRKPACEQLDALTETSPEAAWLCANFEFSEPLYETVYGFFVSAELTDKATFEDFAGEAICRPAGEDVQDLILRGFAAETIARPDTLEACFTLLLDGDVAAVSGEVFAAEALLSEDARADKVVELPDLSLLQSVHAIAPRTKPDATAALAELNAGLIELKVNGEWFRIVGRHLAQN